MRLQRYIYLSNTRQSHSRGLWNSNMYVKYRHFDEIYMIASRVDKMTWWRHQMETFPALLAICAGNSPVPGEFPTQRPVTRSFDAFFDLRQTNNLFVTAWVTPSARIGPSFKYRTYHYSDVIMGAMASQIASLTIVFSTVYSGAHQRKHQSSVSLAFARGIHRRSVNSPHKWPVTGKMFPFDDVIMVLSIGPILSEVSAGWGTVGSKSTFNRPGHYQFGPLIIQWRQ